VGGGLPFWQTDYKDSVKTTTSVDKFC